MPNWCAQRFTLEGSKKDVQRCLDDAVNAYNLGLVYDEGASNMLGVWTPQDKLVPRPEFETQKLVSSYSVRIKGYETDEKGNIVYDNHGPKCVWDLNKASKRPVSLTFTSKWSPSYGISELARLSMSYPTVHFTYDHAERGNDVFGRFSAHNGIVREANDDELATAMGTAAFKKLYAMSG